MSTLTNKIDFALLMSVNGANPNGDPLSGNRPRTDDNGYGFISDVCLKRKLRNRLQDMGQNIFVQSADRCTDGFGSLTERATSVLSGLTSQSDYMSVACETWLDVRALGQVFAFKPPKKSKKANDDDDESMNDGVSVGIRGPVTFQKAETVVPVDITSMKITKSVNSNPNPKGSDKRSSDTMGDKYIVNNAMYIVKGTINAQMAEKTGFTDDDAELIKQALMTLFENDESAARPSGSMEVVKLFWWEHNCKNGQYSSAKVHRLLTAYQNDDETYGCTVDTLPNLSCLELDGF